MKRKTTVASLALCFASGAMCLANPQIGTWKLNEAKSKLDPEMGKNSTVIYQAEGDKIKVTVEGTDPKGKPTHNAWVGKFDGKEYPVTGDPTTGGAASVAQPPMLGVVMAKRCLPWRRAIPMQHWSATTITRRRSPRQARMLARPGSTIACATSCGT